MTTTPVPLSGCSLNCAMGFLTSTSEERQCPKLKPINTTSPAVKKTTHPSTEVKAEAVLSTLKQTLNLSMVGCWQLHQGENPRLEGVVSISFTYTLHNPSFLSSYSRPICENAGENQNIHRRPTRSQAECPSIQTNWKLGFVKP